MHAHSKGESLLLFLFRKGMLNILNITANKNYIDTYLETYLKLSKKSTVFSNVSKYSFTRFYTQLLIDFAFIRFLYLHMENSPPHADVIAMIFTALAICRIEVKLPLCYIDANKTQGLQSWRPLNY